MSGEIKAAGGADKNRGNAERLRAYWVHGEGAAKIGWGTPGDFNRCVSELTPHLGARAKGYCNLRHQDAVGAPPGKGHGHKALAGPGDARDDTAPPTTPQETGVMLALYPSHEVAQQLANLAGPDGTPLTEIHMTLAFLGDEAEVDDPDALVEIARQYAADSPPMAGEISGFGRFTIPDNDAFYASVDVPELSAFREDLLDVLDDEGIAWRTDHGFTPHITLTYLSANEPSPFDRAEAVIPVTFDMLSVAVGGDVWDFPLEGAAATDDEDEDPTEGGSDLEDGADAPTEIEYATDEEYDASQETAEVDEDSGGDTMADRALREREEQPA